MPRRIAAPSVLLGVFYFSLSPAPVCAQVVKTPAGCVPLSSTVRDGKETTNQVLLPRFVVDEIRFDRTIQVPEPDREQLINSLSQQDCEKLSDLIERVKIEVLDNWDKRGFFQANVRVEAASVRGDSAVQRAAVNVHIEEGLQDWLEKLQFKMVNEDAGPPVFSQEELRKAFAIQEGELLDVGKVRHGLEALHRIYAAKGFIDFTPEPQTEVDQVRQRISLTIHLEEQTQFRVGKIEVLRIDARLESLLKSKLRPGDIFNNESLEDFYEQNRAVLPADARLRGEFERNIQNATVDIAFDFRTRPCPLPQD